MRLSPSQYKALLKESTPSAKKKGAPRRKKVVIAPMDALTLQLREHGLPMFITEHRFHPRRLWRFDLCWPEHRVAMEIEGGVWSAGRHTRGAGYVADMEKYNAAVLLGWRLLRFTPDQVRKGEAIDSIRAVLTTSNNHSQEQ